MTDEQTIRAQAWASVFADSASSQVVTDDMTQFAYALPQDQIAGAAKLLLYILTKRGQLRRERARTKGAT